MLSVPFLQPAPFFPPTHSIDGDMAVSYTIYTLFFSNYKLRCSSRNSGALSDTRVFGMPFLEISVSTQCKNVSSNSSSGLSLKFLVKSQS